MPRVPSSSQTSMRRARRMAGEGRRARASPVGRPGRPAARVRGVLVVDDGAVGRRELEPAWNPSRCPPSGGWGRFVKRSRISGRWSSQRTKTKPEMSVEPARSSSRGAMAFRSLLLRATLPQSPCAGSRRPGCPRAAADPAGAGSASIRWMSRSRPGHCVEVGCADDEGSPSTGVNRSRARPLRWRSVPRPSGQDMSTVDVRRTEPGRRGGWRDGRIRRGRGQLRHRRISVFANHVFILGTLLALHIFRSLFW